jgi:hypothetical protein
MPIYTLEGPDGRKYRIEGPAGATAEQLGAVVAGDSKQPEAAPNPTEGMSTFDTLAAGLGKAVVDTGRGVGQMLGVVDRKDIAESRRLDAPLMNTTAGKVGNFLGNAAMIAPTAMIPGAATVPGAAAIGAAFGLAQPSESTKETLANTAIGGAGGAAGQWVANKIPGMVSAYGQRAADQSKQAEQATSQRFAAAQKGSGMGYVVPPADLNPGMMTEALSGLSGKIKTAQVASQRNQTVSDALARKALGVADDTPLNLDTLNNIRQQAGQAYEAVSGAGVVQPSQSYAKALDDALKPFMSQSASFPNRKVPAVVADIEALKTNAFDAGDAIQTIKILRNDADAAYRAGDKLAGAAYKKASGALEDAIDSHLTSVGAPADLLKGYRDARQTIAKTYTVQKALNPETGAIDAIKLASELRKGKPLSGELRDVAEFAQAFPKAAQALKEAPKAVSPLDFAVGLTSTAGTGSPLALGLLGARPAARSLLLSQPMQKAAMKPGYSPSMSSRVLPSLLDTEAFRLMAMPSMVSGGLLGANVGQ